MLQRVIWIVLDSVGIGELPDAHKYGDEGSNTLGNIASFVQGISLPNLQRLGLGNITPIQGVPPALEPRACFGKMAEKSPGKDTTTGHWEMAGLVLTKPFPTYPDGFPSNLISKFEQEIGSPVLGNKAASGTVIIEELGAKHLRTGYPIVYTSADSVFQIAAHEEVIPLDKLYNLCQTARTLLKGEHEVGRVIARPFIGKLGSFQRTPNRRDYSLKPTRATILDHLIQAGYEVNAIGKIAEIFAGQGITRSFPIQNNDEGVAKTIAAMDTYEKGLIFANLVDFDSIYGHRNDPIGYAKALERFDQQLPTIVDKMKPWDVLLLTADHGCDPTTPSTDHSREYVPLLIFGEQLKSGICLGVRSSFSDLGKTVGDLFGIKADIDGETMLPLIVQ